MLRGVDNSAFAHLHPHFSKRWLRDRVALPPYCTLYNFGNAGALVIVIARGYDPSHAGLQHKALKAHYVLYFYALIIKQ